jgi:hypothetical protein
MTPGLQSTVAVTYVRDMDRSRAFYELLGFGRRPPKNKIPRTSRS